MKYDRCPHCGKGYGGLACYNVAINGTATIICKFYGDVIAEDIDATPKYTDEELYCEECGAYVCTYGEMMEEGTQDE